MEKAEAGDRLRRELQYLRKGRGVSLAKLRGSIGLAEVLGTDEPQEMSDKLRHLVTVLGTDRSGPALYAAFNFDRTLNGSLDVRRAHVLSSSRAHSLVTSIDTVRYDENLLIEEIIIQLRPNRKTTSSTDCTTIDLSYIGQRLLAASAIAGKYGEWTRLDRSDDEWTSRDVAVPLYIWLADQSLLYAEKIKFTVRVLEFSADNFQVTHVWRVMRGSTLTEILATGASVRWSSKALPQHQVGSSATERTVGTPSVTRFGSVIDVIFSDVRVGEYLAVGWSPDEEGTWLDQSEPSIANEDWGIGYPPYPN